MDFTIDEPKAILAKSFVLIQKSVDILSQLDNWRFPTASTEIARTLLRDSYKRLCDPANLAPLDPIVLYNRLFSIQDLAEIVERSTTDHISWPLVSYCDEIWRQLFDLKTAAIFYSVTSEHNYTILQFSGHLSFLLKDLLSTKELAFIGAGPQLYCLQLASAEDANLPLYANIGHEFGHAVFDSRRSDLVNELDTHFQPILHPLVADIQAADPTKAPARFQRIGAAIVGLAEELFCDLVGARLMGPAFFLSLYEVAWGQTKETSWITLSPDAQRIRAYPSFHFRLHCIRKWAAIDNFCSEAASDFAKLDTARHVLAECLKTVPTSHGTDSVKVMPTSDEDAAIIGDVMEKHMPSMKTALEAFLTKASQLLSLWYPNIAKTVSTREIGFQTLFRAKRSRYLVSPLRFKLF